MKHKLLNTFSGLLIFITAISSFASEVNVYSYREPQLIAPIFDAFSKKTGIKVNSVFAKKGMLERLRNEGRNSPADLIFTVDIGRLTDFKNAGLIQAVESNELKANIPENFRDPDDMWFGLTSRARILVVSKDRVQGNEISSYEDLIRKDWKGRVCARQGKHPYMVALTASVIANKGYISAKDWLLGLKQNLARRPQGNDRAQVKAIYSGLCDVAIINHYYMVRMLKDSEQKNWANAVRIVFPNQSDRGTHMNVSGVALAKFAPNPKAAIALMDFLSSPEGQRLYAQRNGEYPVNPLVKASDMVAQWGDFKQDTLDLAKIAEFREDAVKLADEISFND